MRLGPDNFFRHGLRNELVERDAIAGSKLCGLLSDRQWQTQRKALFVLTSNIHPLYFFPRRAVDSKAALARILSPSMPQCPHTFPSDIASDITTFAVSPLSGHCPMLSLVGREQWITHLQSKRCPLLPLKLAEVPTVL